jgi:Transposase-associated domain
MRQKNDHIILCLCRNYQNVRRFYNIEDIRNYLIMHGFKEWYTRWIWHGEWNNEGSTNATINDESSGELKWGHRATGWIGRLKYL